MADEYPYYYRSMPPYQSMFRHLQCFSKVATNVVDVFVRPYEETYFLCDGISNHFSEKERVKASINGKPCPYDFWLSSKSRQDFPKSSDINVTRDFIYQNVKGCGIFNASLAVYMYTAFAPRRPGKEHQRLRILDPSAGWGDRMIAALACGHYYQGYDPNPNMEQCYNKIKEAFDPSGHLANVVISPFEIQELERESFDMVVTSPPFFDLEVYIPKSSEKSKTQSITMYPKITDWLEKMYCPYLQKAWDATKSVMIVYVSNYKNTEGVVVRLEELTVEIMGLFGAKLKGKYYFASGPKSTPRPFFLFERTSAHHNL